MEYIRLSKAQPDYDPNTRHCLYGLDADLIMLGLLSHDPHFALLREEVTFGPKKRKTVGVENTNFYLMHLSLLREYLDLEFGSLKESLPFEYNLEKIIDDFILLAIFVGNDFLPHLPGLHIHEGALTLMFGIYKRVLVKAGGYINEEGTINLPRLQMVFDELKDFERDQFESEFADSAFYKGKQARKVAASSRKLVLTPAQKLLYEQVKKFVLERPEDALHFPSTLPKGDTHFVKTLAQKLGLHSAIEFAESTKTSHIYIDFEESEEDDTDDEESQAAIQRVLKKYEKAPVEEEQPEDNLEDKELFDQKFLEWKQDYYKSKLEFDYDNKEALNKLAYRYVEGLQWVLRYYYSGVSSWGWFYDYHYSPKISDLTGLADMKFHFELGKPFLPFQQLMGVLPELSKKLVPEPYRDLMSDSDSPIADFYPHDFAMDMNGKKADWEAVVKIPFIDEKRLIAAMQTREHRLTEAERKRNTHSESFKFVYNPNQITLVPSPSPGFLPDLPQCKCSLTSYHLPTLEGGLSFKNHLLPGVKTGKYALAGFPSIETLAHTGTLGFHGVNVFQQDSKNETMVVTLDNRLDGQTAEAIAKASIDQPVFVGWPFLQEGVVVAVSDELFRYEINDAKRKDILRMPHRAEDLEKWRRNVDRIDRTYSKRYGTIIGHTDILFHVALLKGLKRLNDGSMVKEFAAIGQEIEFAAQTTVDHVESVDNRHKQRPPPPITEDFPVGSPIFFLGSKFYGNAAGVVGYAGEKLNIAVLSNSSRLNDKNIGRKIIGTTGIVDQYYPSYVVSKRVGISGLALSKLTASFFVEHDQTRVNLGLNLKFEAKRQKVLGYTRKTDAGWEFSDKAIDLIREYKQTFPVLIQGLEAKAKDDMYRSTNFFSHSEVDAKMTEIKAWLKEKGVRDFDRVPLDAMNLDKASITQLERVIDNILQEEASTKKLQINNIPRQAVLKPGDSQYRLHEQQFALGDRVVSTIDSGNVPIAAKGTVVGVGRGSVDVVFDESFMSGNSLGERCSPYRGMSVPLYTVLNLTQQQLITAVGTEGENAPENGIWRQTAMTSTPQTNGHNKPANGGIPPPAGLYDNKTPTARGRGRGRGGSVRGTAPGISFANAAQGQRGEMEHLTRDTALLSLLTKDGQTPIRGRGRGRGEFRGRGEGRGHGGIVQHGDFQPRGGHGGQPVVNLPGRSIMSELPFIQASNQTQNGHSNGSSNGNSPPQQPPQPSSRSILNEFTSLVGGTAPMTTPTHHHEQPTHHHEQSSHRGGRGRGRRGPRGGLGYE